MKKTLTAALILLIAGGAAFFLGWAQRGVPPGAWGVVRSKTHGTDPVAVRAGPPRWLWYKLIPGNAGTAVFTLADRTTAVESAGTLPSGEVYTAFAGLSAGFSYRIAVSVTWRLRGESLPELAERENLSGQDDLDPYLARLSGDIERHTRGLLWTYGESEAALREAQRTGTLRDLEDRLRAAFPQADILGCQVNALQFPDFILYEEARGLYRDYLEAQRGAARDKITLLAEENAQRRLRLEELSAYGELLSKYPVLLKYLALEKGVQREEE